MAKVKGSKATAKKKKVKSQIEKEIKEKIKAAKAARKAKQKEADKARAKADTMQDKIDALRSAKDDLECDVSNLEDEIYDLDQELDAAGNGLDDLDIYAPYTGSFTCYKKAVVDAVKGAPEERVVVELFVPAKSARRQELGKSKLRVSSAKVVAIFDVDGNPVKHTSAKSLMPHTNTKDKARITYAVGQTVKSDKFDRTNTQCSHGIHVYMKQEDAQNH
jgi:hypothetical protein